MKSKVKGTYLILLKEKAKAESMPEQVQLLLSKFQHVVPKELSNKLPPMRNVQHQINLVLGAILPNLLVT